MNIKILFTLLFANFLVTSSGFAISPQPFFDIQIDRFEDIFTDPKYFNYSTVKVRKVNKTRSIVGEMVNLQPIGNDVLGGGNLYKKQGNEYRLMPYKVQMVPLCDALINDGEIYMKIN